MGGVRPLRAALTHPAARDTLLQQGLQEQVLRAASQHPVAELREDREVKARIAQLQPQGILPVDASPHRLGRLAVREAFHELEHADEGEAPRGRGRLPTHGEECGEVVIRVDGADRLPEGQAERPFREGRLGDPGRLGGHRGKGLRPQRHCHPPCSSRRPRSGLVGVPI
jgi:hypothetical protein